MDENYLDNLLNEVSLDKEIDHKIEEELDSQIQKEKRQYQEQQILSDEDLFNIDLEREVNDMQSEQDLHFSHEQMDELDQLDNLADLDIGDLDFSDIDFDDLDITKLDDIETEDLDDLLKDFESDLEIDTFFDASNNKETQEFSEEEISEKIIEDGANDFYATDFVGADTTQVQTEDLNEDSFDADQFLDSLLEETAPQKQAEIPTEEKIEESLDDLLSNSNNSDATDEELDLLSALEEFGMGSEVSSQEEPMKELSDGEEAQLDDLFSLLDLDELLDDEDKTANDSVEQAQSVASSEDTIRELDDLEDLEDISREERTFKQKFMEVLFGEPDEDDILSEEELAEIEQKKSAKKEKKQAAKKARKEKAKVAKEEKAIKNTQKKKDEEDRKKLKAKKKELLREEELAELANEKKLNKPMVIFIFTLFLGGTFLFFVATDNFNYSLAIERATNYFANQKYRKAFDEIVGVEVKEKDEDLKDRIYTVMYVERLYEAYLNNIDLDRQEKALDSLLRGVSKYYEHYEEAKELGVTSDMDYSFNQIRAVLSEQYGITVEQAVEINRLTNYEYVQYIQTMVEEKRGSE